jgi:hypothetical protein
LTQDGYGQIRDINEGWDGMAAGHRYTRQGAAAAGIDVSELLGRRGVVCVVSNNDSSLRPTWTRLEKRSPHVRACTLKWRT